MNSKKDSLLNLKEKLLEEESKKDSESSSNLSPSDFGTLSNSNLKWNQSKAAIIGLSSLTLFIDMVGYGIVVPILPDFIIEELNLNPDLLGVLFASYALGLFVATPLVSYIADKYHDRKYCMLLGLFGLLGSTLWFAFSTSYTDLLIARFLQGFSSSASWTTSLALCADVCINDLGKNMGFVFSFNSMGFLLGPVIGGYLYEHHGFQIPFYLLAVLCIIGIIYRLFVDEKPLTDLKLEWIAEQSNSDCSGSSSIWTLLSDRRILLGLTIVIITEGILAGIEPVLPLFLHEYLGSTPTQVGIFMILAALPNVLFASKIGAFSEKFGELKTIIYGLFAVLVTAPLMGLANSPLWSGVTIFIFGTSLYIANVPALSYCGKTSTSYGSIYGSFSLAFSFASFIGPTISSAIYTRMGFPAVCISFSIASAILGILCLVSLRRSNYIQLE
eukprot:NODE_6_length_70510_cov_1.054395.p16 type:complete len:444 gc:universal NODE_6_length_70510_cov_1.054395:26670-25339(-)